VVTVRFGAEVHTCPCSVNGTGLLLLRSLYAEHKVGGELQMLPCCAHSLIAAEGADEVFISGCNVGLDWDVLHRDGAIYLRTPMQCGLTVDMEAYRGQVFAFADAVEAFYAAALPKQPEHEYDAAGYAAFWREWHRLRGK
jgi:hypothetical protein